MKVYTYWDLSLSLHTEIFTYTYSNKKHSFSLSVGVSMLKCISRNASKNAVTIKTNKQKKTFLLYDTVAYNLIAETFLKHLTGCKIIHFE